MLTLFQKLQKKAEKTTQKNLGADLEKAEKAENVEEEEPALVVTKPLTEESLKKSIASKLQSYRPLERDSSFTGPNYHS